MKVNLLFGNNFFTATWQTKTFSDETVAMEFIRKHRDKIHGINGNVIGAKTFSHFEIMDMLRKG